MYNICTLTLRARVQIFGDNGNKLTEYVLGTKLSQVAELHVDVDDGDTPGQAHDDHVTAFDVLRGNTKLKCQL